MGDAREPETPKNVPDFLYNLQTLENSMQTLVMEAPAPRRANIPYKTAQKTRVTKLALTHKRSKNRSGLCACHENAINSIHNKLKKQVRENASSLPTKLENRTAGESKKHKIPAELQKFLSNAFARPKAPGPYIPVRPPRSVRPGPSALARPPRSVRPSRSDMGHGSWAMDLDPARNYGHGRWPWTSAI